VSRWNASLTIAALATALAPPPVQLAFAILGIGVIGMVHGAGDLAVVALSRRPTFLTLYGLVSVTTLLWWTACPAMALPAFLTASAIHFGIEDAPEGSVAERVARGVGLIASPATLHRDGYMSLLHAAGGSGWTLVAYGQLLALLGGLAGAALLVLALTRRDMRLGGAVCELLILPPLIGFTIGFLILHALPQTNMRRERLGHASIIAYLRAVAPIILAALSLIGATILLLRHFEPTGVRGLFAGIAALALPHLLVTPMFEERDGVGRPALAAGR
jgi:Brp/Blh family beta-carotene 15,15'-monooxygenase